MLKVNIDQKNKQTRVMGGGPLHEVITDICVVINGMYSQLMRGGHEEEAKEFRMAMIWMHTNPESALFDVDEEGSGLCIVTEGSEDE